MATAAVVAVLGQGGLPSAQAQQRTPADSARCDSVLAAARRDSVPIAIFLFVARTDGFLDPEQNALIATQVATSFAPPRPFRLSVFAGPARMRGLRPMSSDTAGVLRAPTLTGVYRFVTDKDGSIHDLTIIRASMMTGFDSSAMEAIRAASELRNALMPGDGADSMRIVVRFATDSLPGARRIVSGFFPRMPIIDAVPATSNPPAPFPDEERADSVTSGEVVLRFIVDRTGSPMAETMEVVRASSVAFLKSALLAVPQQRFVPATIHGCAVAQLVDYSFSFFLPPAEPRLRH